VLMVTMIGTRRLLAELSSLGLPTPYELHGCVDPFTLIKPTLNKLSKPGTHHGLCIGSQGKSKSSYRSRCLYLQIAIYIRLSRSSHTITAK
jgi:hypothetical protein